MKNAKRNNREHRNIRNTQRGNYGGPHKKTTGSVLEKKWKLPKKDQKQGGCQMKTYTTDKIRNLALVGHSGCGKTTLTENLLFRTGVTNRLGRVEDGNTQSDFDKEEIARKVSIRLSMIPIEWKDAKFNLIDTPGYFDFSGEVYAAMRASEAALVVIDASSGIEVGTEKVLSYTKDIELPRIIFANKMDKDNVNIHKLLGELRDKYGKIIVPFTLPIGEGADFRGVVDVLNKIAYDNSSGERKEIPIPADMVDEVDELFGEITEIVADTDDGLMEKFFSGETFNHDEFIKGVTKALLNGTVVPFMVGSTTKSIGIDIMLDIILDYMPAPNYEGAKYGFRHDMEEDIPVDVNQPYCAVVFKTIVDPFVGKISIFKVISGKIKKETEIYNSTKEKMDKVGGLFYLRGKNQIETNEVVAGDIGAFSKLTITQTGDTLSDKSHPIVFKPIKTPQPNLFIAIEPKNKGDDEKIGAALSKMHEEDPSFVIVRNSETKQQTLGGQGDVQLQIILDRLKNTYGLEARTIPFRIAYRETIKGKSDVQGKHKKQSGGAGQYGDVHIRFEHSDELFEFKEEVFGGAVPKNFFPAVEKGLRDSLEKGVLAGYPVVNVKATLYDGSYHAVDSNEMAFKIAASLAFKKGMEEASPILLEPIMKVEVKVPEVYMGDIMGDMNKRRGKILKMEPIDDGYELVVAEAPHSELFEYAIDLRSMSHARGSYKTEFVRYDEVPHHIAEKIVAEYKAEREKENK